MAQSVARVRGTDEVAGSIPAGSTTARASRGRALEGWQSPVYCARLESGAGLAAHGGSNPSPSARSKDGSGGTARCEPVAVEHSPLRRIAPHGRLAQQVRART